MHFITFSSYEKVRNRALPNSLRPFLSANAKCEASGTSLKQCEFLDDGGLISLTVGSCIEMKAFAAAVQQVESPSKQAFEKCGPSRPMTFRQKSLTLPLA